MAISKSTPYVRYKKNFTSNLHLGTIHVESEYLDRTQKTTIESIHGMTWHNKVVNENKELDLLSNLGFELTESKKEYFNVGEQRVSVDEIHGMQDIEPNEDGTYTYSVTSIEGEYAEIYDGLNHITSTSDGLDGNFEIVYDTDEEDITGSVVLDATMPNYTIEDSNVGELNNVVFKGETLVNILPQPSLRNKMENASMQRLNEGHDEVVVVDGEYKSAILKGCTLVNVLDYNKIVQNDAYGSPYYYRDNSIAFDKINDYRPWDDVTPWSENIKPSTKYIALVQNTGLGETTIEIKTSFSQTSIIRKDLSLNEYTIIQFTSDDNPNGFIAKINGFDANPSIKLMVIEYQDGMENWDIPYFEGMQSVKMPVLTTTGKNMFDGYLTFGNIAGGNGADINYSSTMCRTNYHKVEGGAYFTVSIDGDYVVEKISEVDENKNFVRTTEKSLPYISIQLTEKTKYLRCVFKHNASEELVLDKVKQAKIQFEHSSSPTPYEPFKSNILTVNEAIELRGIGDVKDELNLLTGELTQRIGSTLIEGGVWILNGASSQPTVRFSYTNRILIGANTPNRNVVADKIPTLSPSDSYEKESYGIGGLSGNLLYLYIPRSWIGLDINDNDAESANEKVKAYMDNLGEVRVQYQLETPTTKTIDLQVTDQDNVVLETGKPRSYKDGHIQVQSNGILPSSISYEVPSQNHMYVDMLKPSNTYTLKRNGENFEGSFFIDGTEYNTNVFMTSHQLPNKSLIINDMGEHDKVAMFEGNYGTSTIPYFEGMASVKMPVLTTTGKNLFDISTWKTDMGRELTVNTNGFKIEGSRGWFVLPVEIGEQYVLKYFGNNSDNNDYGLEIYETDNPLSLPYAEWSLLAVTRFTNPATISASHVFTYTPKKKYLIVFHGNGRTINIEQIQLEKGAVATSYEPHKSNILTCNEEVTLRGIGEVKDEYNVETGELTQYIGEAIYTEKESWHQYLANDFDNSCLFSCTSLKIGDTSDSSMKTNFISDRFTPSTQIFMNDIIGSYIQGGSLFIRVKKEWLSTPDVYGLQKYLQSNPITVQYQLAQPITRKVISTILDQDGRQKHSMSTYTGLTNLSTSSDTLIPNVSLDYEISSSTGTVIGTSATIENGENGSPISAIVYGESLVNNIQEPSDVECVVLGEHSGNNITIENSVEGNIENAIIEGNTLVNLMKKFTPQVKSTRGDDVYIEGDSLVFKPSLSGVDLTNRYMQFNNPFNINLEVGKKYTLIVKVEENTLQASAASAESHIVRTFVGNKTINFTKSTQPGIYSLVFTPNEDISAVYVYFYASAINSENCTGGVFRLSRFMTVLEGDYSQYNIKPFEGLGSVKEPTLKVTGKNLIDKIKTEKGYLHNDNPYSVTIISQMRGERTTEYIKVKPNTTYTYTLYNLTTDIIGDTFWNGWYYYKNIGEVSSITPDRQVGYAQSTCTFTTPSDCNYIRISSRGLEYETTDVMLSEDTSSVPYEPYQSNTLIINEPIELRAIGDVRDELDLVTGKLTQRVEEVELNILSITHTGTNFNGNDRFLLNLQNSISNFNELLANNIINNHCFTYSPTAGYNYGGNNSYYFYAQNQIYISFTAEKYTVETLRDLFNEKPFIIQLPTATNLIKTIDLTVTDQDGNPTSLHSYNDTTHITTNSQGLTANVEISNPSYDVVLKANTKYTLKLNRTNAPTNTPLEINLGGTEATMDSTVNSIAITTPSTLANNKLTLGGVGNKFKEAMVIEGDCVDRDLGYFEGIVGVENPVVVIGNGNLWSQAILPKTGNDFNITAPNQPYSTTLKPILQLQPNTTYRINQTLRVKNGQIVFNLYEKQIDGTLKGVFSQNRTNNTNEVMEYTVNTSMAITTGEIYLNIYPTMNDTDLQWALDTINQSSMTIFKEGDYPNNTHLSTVNNILTTYPQITLRSIGDIKDEWDVVGGTVTRHIGEIVLDGSEKIITTTNGENVNKIAFTEKLYFQSSGGDDCNYLMCDKLRCVKYSGFAGRLYDFISIGDNGVAGKESAIFIKFNSATTVDEWKDLYSQITPITLYYQLETPTTESVYITPPTPRTSTASVTLSTQLGESDYVTWNPYKEHYVHYNYEQDGSYTWDNLTDLNERQFIELYDRRTYVEQEYKNTFLSHDSKGTSKYVLIEPNQDYTVTVRFSELPQCETVKVNLGGSEVEMNVSDPHVHVTTPSTLSNYLCSISGKGLSGKITDILVIHCLEHEGFADIDYFEGIDSIGEVVDGKASIIVEQTNGNLIDKDFEVWNNGQSIRMSDDERLVVHPNTKYVVKFRRDMDKELAYTIYVQLFNKDNVQTRIVNGGATQESNTREFTTNHDETMVRLYTSQITNNGSTHTYWDADLCYADMEKDYIRPRYNSSQEIILPMQLCRINTVYDNFYYDVIRGHYRIQQSIGHKYFTGADNENWTMIENGERILRFRYNNADIQIKSLGEYMTNRFTNGTTTSPYESCAFNGSTFIISIDKERLSNATLTAFKEWLSSHNVHLYYQLATPMMIDLPQYSSKLELNTYKDEIYTFLKNCKPTVFTLDVPLDQTYRFYELQESQGYTNRIELTDERMTEEDALYINTIYGSGISNLIEEPNNVDTMLKPNYEGKATSHSLINGKVSTIGVHGFEPNGVKVGAYNTVTKQYELTVKATSGENNNSVAFPIPYALEQYEDGTKDRVYYNSQYKQWMFEGGQTLTVAYNSSTGVFTNAVEVFRGMMPRSGMIGEFKVKFASGTTSARLYYSLDGSTYTYTTLRNMTDGVEYYIAFFNTGGTKIDMGTKIGADSEYVTLVPLSGTVSEALMINQIQGITECTYYLDKTYYYTEPTKPIELTVYEGTNTIIENNGAIVTIENNAHNKDALIYANTPYTVYWTYVGGQGNIKVTLGGATQEVVATQGYVTITTSDTDLERGLLIGGFDVTIKDLMLVKGERIADLSYFEGSRAVGTAFVDEDGNTMYRITLVTGSELIQDKFEDVITFEDNKKHNVLVTKLLGTKPNKN